MKKYRIYLLFLFILPISFIGCKDTKTVEPTIDILTNYLVENDMDLPSIIKYHSADADIKFVVEAPATAADVPAFVDKYYIIDIRNEADYNLGHIEGAHLSSIGNILNEATNAGDKPILTVCYSGQGACFSTALLRLYGYRDAQALKWGMSGWNSDFDKWSGKVGDPAKDNVNWSYDAAPTPVKMKAPSLSENITNGGDLLKSRVETVVAEGFKTISAADVLENPSNYFINNYFGEADYSSFGHIKGAYRINPLSIADDLIYNIDPDAKVVTYCYTGQTSAVITAYLRVLGYDAYSLLYGMNGLYNSNSAWTANQWGYDSKSKDLPVVTK